MKKSTLKNLLSLLTVVMFVSRALAAGTKLITLYSFTGGKDGATPISSLVVDQFGNLYGTTTDGGSANCEGGCGTIFELVAPTSQSGTWTEKVLYRFTDGNDGELPLAGLVADATGNLYGTTNSGGNPGCDSGCGVVFELVKPAVPGAVWALNVLHSFTGQDGAYSQARLTFNSAGNLYGTAAGGGVGRQCATNNVVGCGVVFELSPPAQQGGPWTYDLLYSFGVDVLTNGVTPFADVVLDQAGNLYGTTINGGAFLEGGTIFELSPPNVPNGAWTENVLYSFQGNGPDYGPAAGVIFDHAGNLYGTTNQGGFAFELSSLGGGAWSETVIASLSSKLKDPEGDLMMDSAGNLYGTAYSDGLFELQNSNGGWSERELPLSTGTRPTSPRAALIFGKGGAIYGTSVAGGTSQNCRRGCGTVFAVTQ